MRHSPPSTLLWSALALGSIWGCADAPPPPPPAPPATHAVLIVLDTLRADVLTQANTPVIDGLASAGASVPRAWSAGTWTVPSVISLLTGMSVRQHGWDLPTGRIGKYPPLPTVDTLATVLHAQGFATDGWYANPYLAEDLGFSRGFDSWHRSADPSMPGQLAKLVKGQFDDGRRHFVYLHFIGAHSPLRPSDDARQRHALSPQWFDERGGMNIGLAKRDRPAGARQAYAQAYSAVVEDLDTRVGEVLTALGEHRNDTLIVLVSDHGELLGEHDVVGHGSQIWEGLTHVPLIIDHPGIAGADETLPASLGLPSVPALMTEALGVEHSWPTKARASSPLFSQREGQLAALLDGQTKAIWDAKGGAARIYDLVQDAEEQHASDDDGRFTSLRSSWESQVPPGTLAQIQVELPKQTTDELKALGYLAPESP